MGHVVGLRSIGCDISICLLEEGQLMKLFSNTSIIKEKQPLPIEMLLKIRGVSSIIAHRGDIEILIEGFYDPANLLPEILSILKQFGLLPSADGE